MRIVETGARHIVGQEFHIVQVVELYRLLLLLQVYVFLLVWVFGEVVLADPWLLILGLVLLDIVDIAAPRYLGIDLLQQASRLGSLQALTILLPFPEEPICQGLILIGAGVGHKGLNLGIEVAWFVLGGGLELLLPGLVLVIPILPVDYLLSRVHVQDRSDVLPHQVELRVVGDGLVLGFDGQAHPVCQEIKLSINYNNE